MINQAITGDFDVYYWRESNYEVDFVMENSVSIIVLEVKTGIKAENQGMRIFSEKYHPLKMFTIGTGGIPYEF